MEKSKFKGINEDDTKKILEFMQREPKSQVYNISNLRDMIEDGELLLSPDYQRKYVTKTKKASTFIESIFLGCVIPEVQFFENEQGIIEVLDGQQRITSLINFLNNEFVITGLTTLKFLNGKRFRDLPVDLQRKYKNYGLSARIMKNNSDNEYKYFVFHRLNTGSKKLSTQDIRNCVYRGNLISLAKELAKNKDVEEVLGFIKNNRHERTEFILRIISIANIYPNLKVLAGHNINYFLKNNQNCSEQFIEETKKQFLKSIRLIKEYIGIESFVNKKKVVSKTNVEPVLINFYILINSKDVINNADDIKNAIKNTINNCNEYSKYVTLQTDSRVNILNKILIMNKVIQEAIEKGITLDSKRNFSLNDRLFLWNKSIEIYSIPKCEICGQEILKFNHSEADHIVPFSKGGKTVIDNAQLVHSTCNKIKSNSLS